LAREKQQHHPLAGKSRRFHVFFENSHQGQIARGYVFPPCGQNFCYDPPRRRLEEFTTCLVSQTLRSRPCFFSSPPARTCGLLLKSPCLHSSAFFFSRTSDTHSPLLPGTSLFPASLFFPLLQICRNTEVTPRPPPPCSAFFFQSSVDREYTSTVNHNGQVFFSFPRQGRPPLVLGPPFSMCLLVCLFFFSVSASPPFPESESRTRLAGYVRESGVGPLPPFLFFPRPHGSRPPIPRAGLGYNLLGISCCRTVSLSRLYVPSSLSYHWAPNQRSHLLLRSATQTYSLCSQFRRLFLAFDHPPLSDQLLFYAPHTTVFFFERKKECYAGDLSPRKTSAFLPVGLTSQRFR